MGLCRIELTDEVVKAITKCCPLKDDESSVHCDKRCALAGACLEYYTGDQSENPKKISKNFAKPIDKYHKV